MSHPDTKQAFDMADVDKDGFISVEELKKMLHSIGLEVSDKDTQELFDLYDANKNGKIEYHEFELLYKELQKHQ